MQTATYSVTFRFYWKEDFFLDESNFFIVDTEEDQDIGPTGTVYGYTRDKIYDSDGYDPPKSLNECGYEYVEDTFKGAFKETLKEWNVESYSYDQIHFEQGIYIVPKKLKNAVENRTISKATIKRYKYSCIGLPMRKTKCETCEKGCEYQRKTCGC